MAGILFSLNKAVPGAGILDFGDPGKLALATRSWERMNRFIGRIEGLPADFGTGSAATSRALDELRVVAGDFGSPRQLRRMIQERPDALSGERGPSLPYAAIVWLAQRLHASAGTVTSNLRALTDPSGSGEDRRTILRELASQAGEFQGTVGTLANSLKRFKAAASSALSDLSLAFEADAEVLHELQEALGELQGRVEGGHRKDKAASERQEFEQTKAKAEKLRAAIGELEPILDDGAWLESGVDDLADYVGNLTRVWADFGTGMAEMASEAAASQLEDPAWLEQSLGLDDALRRWNAIDRVAKRFVAESLVDFPLGPPSY
jgi:hypothetical protein